MRKRRIMISLALSAGMMMCSGCEKKADTVEGYTEKSTAAESGETAADKSSEDNGKSEEKSAPGETERWYERIEGTGDGFEYIDAAVSLKDYSVQEMNVITVEYEKFDADFAKKMCDTVFDNGEVEVYDYSNKSKKLYDDVIEDYSEALELYDMYDEKGIDQAFQYAPDEFMANGYWSLSENIERMDRSVIEEDYNALLSERESAPEKIENDYSYGGYLGKIDGEEFYMIFGNRNYNEYLNSIDTLQYNGRVVTIMRRDLESAFAGHSIAEIMEKEGADPSELDLVLEDASFKMNSLIGSSPMLQNIGGDTADDEKMLEQAEEFLGRLGYNDYSFCEDEIGELIWSNKIDDGFMYANGYKMVSYMQQMNDGKRYRFDISSSGMERLEHYDLQMPVYSEDGDTLDYDSFVDVYVNANGVLGCQIYNPASVVKSEPVKSIIDRDTVKDIVRESVDDKELWNIPYGRKVNLFNLDSAKLVSFPIRSDKEKGEYTLVPCYVIYSRLMDEYEVNSGYIIPAKSDVDSPFIVINALDGSVVTVEDQLTDYPAGWDNGNVGYTNYVAGQWKRNERNPRLGKVGPIGSTEE